MSPPKLPSIRAPYVRLCVCDVCVFCACACVWRSPGRPNQSVYNTSKQIDVLLGQLDHELIRRAQPALRDAQPVVIDSVPTWGFSLPCMYMRAADPRAVAITDRGGVVL